jgi:ABC-type bacteriocin/lantibiotic exporter with double-glycine peptidase domain
MTPISRIEPQKASAEAVTERHDSGIRALASVARHHGLDWSLTRLSHVYGADHEPDARAMVRMARAEGLKADVQKMDWKKAQQAAKAGAVPGAAEQRRLVCGAEGRRRCTR